MKDGLADSVRAEMESLLAENFSIFHRSHGNDALIREPEWGRLTEVAKRLTELGYFQMSQKEQKEMYARAIKSTL